MNFIYSVGLFVFLLIWHLVKNNPLNITKPVAIALGSFFISLTASLFNSADKLTGLLMLCQYLNACLLFLACQYLPPEDKEKTAQCLILAAILISLFALYQFFFGFQYTLNYITIHQINDPVAQEAIRTRRAFAPFITPNALGGYLIMLIPLAFAMAKFRWTFLLLAAALIVTRSLGAIFSLCSVLIFYYLWEKQIKLHVLFAAIFLMTLTMVTLFLRTQTDASWYHPLFSSQMRWDYWVETWHLIKAHPWIGVGLGGFDLTNSRYAHNSYLQLWAEAGPLAIGALMFLLATLIRASLAFIRDTKSSALTTASFLAICAFLVHNIIDFTLLLPETGLIAAVIAGLVLKPAKPSQPTAA
jgi:O-antigen ligase